MTKINIFNMIAAVSLLLLVSYAWFILLPEYEGVSEYSSFRDIVIVTTVLLVLVAGIQMYLSVKKEESQVNKPAEEQVEK